MDVMQQIRRDIYREEFDYLLLLESLSSYKQPRDVITRLLKNESIIRVKKGIYVFGQTYRKRPYSLEVLSNMIYGPSYVSFEYALAYYGLIPEAVRRVTCASYKRNKHFSTPAGEFVYHYVPPKAFCLGMTRQVISTNNIGGENTYFLIASQEKALADLIARMKPFMATDELLTYLIEGMRIEKDSLFKLNVSELEKIKSEYQNQNVTLLWKILKR